MSGGVFSQEESSSAPASVMWKPFCGPSLAGLVGLDEPVALEALERRVHLTDVERPHLAGARLELLLQLEPVLRALTEEGEDGVPDTHCAARSLIIRSMVQVAVRRSSLDGRSTPCRPGSDC